MRDPPLSLHLLSQGPLKPASPPLALSAVGLHAVTQANYGAGLPVDSAPPVPVARVLAAAATAAAADAVIHHAQQTKAGILIAAAAADAVADAAADDDADAVVLDAHCVCHPALLRSGTPST